METAHRVPPAELETVLTRLWDTLNRPAFPSGPFWQPVYTPLWPDRWPPSPTTLWQRYGAAYGQDVNLVDGVQVARPWVRLDFTAEAAPITVTPLAAALEPAGVQGVRPLTPAAARVLAGAGEVERLARGLRGAPNSREAETLRAYYQQWLTNHGQLGQLTEPAHAAFRVWLRED